MQFQQYISKITNLGIPEGCSLLDVIRCRVINWVNIVMVVLASLLIFYRLLLQDYEAVYVNSILVAITLILIFLCLKGKHQWSIIGIMILVIFLTLDLTYSANYHYSALIFWALTPIGFDLMSNDRYKKHLYFLICILLFCYTSRSYDYDVNIYTTFLSIVTIFHLTINKFIAFLEKKQNEATEALIEKESVIIELKSKNDDLNRFSYICSHDLKEPIRNIGSYMGLMEMKLKEESLKHDYEEYFNYTNSAVKTLYKILDSLRIYTELNDNKEILISQCKIDEIVTIAVNNLESLTQERNAKVSFQNKTTENYIYSNYSGLIIILQNLIQNGIKYNTSTVPEVNITLKQKEAYFLFDVVDNGIGIEKQYQQYIFQPFKTIANKSATCSSGLGLTICSGIAKKIGGEILMESTKGNGSVFTLQVTNLQAN